ncbi:MAG: ROK family protein [Candidatus Dormibacteraeota bacterium]|uniref:ROK family protein n=1 Tax=Candidatus Amunia macphersoniae TaxID=3127014 RepID=A0A934KCJ4_9BACT|nr:ROK family protein [Candidatus Dormibacteraeota bacterium]
MIGLIDIGGTKLLAAVGERGRGVAATVRRPTPRHGDMVAVLIEMLDDVRHGQSLEAIGVAAPGPFDRAGGTLMNPPGMSSDWHRQELATPLRKRFGCPVQVENDANCAALAEAHLGAGRGSRLLVYYTVSTGIGTGVVLDGELVVQRHDNEGGHQVLWPRRLGGPPCECGGAGCLEAIASGRAIAARFGRSGEDIEEQAVWDEVGTWLGLAVVNTVALLDCDRVVFGGGVAVPRWSRVEPALNATVAAHLKLQPAPEIRPAELGEDRNLAGVLLLLGR